MKTVPSMKKRERLAIESFVRDTKVKGQKLTFSVDDVIVHHPTMKLHRKAVAKALGNMIYAKAGIMRSPAGPGICVVASDTLPWMKDVVGADQIVAAATSNVRRRRRKGRAGAAPKYRATESTTSAVNTKRQLVADVTATVQAALAAKAEDLFSAIDAVLAAIR